MTLLTLLATTVAVLSIRIGSSEPRSAVHALLPGPAPAGAAQNRPEAEVPAAVADLAAAAVMVRAGPTRWQGFFVGPGLVVTSAASLAGRQIVQLVSGAGRTGLAQVVATDDEAQLAVLRVHVDITPRVVVETGEAAGQRLPRSAFVLRHGDRSEQAAERVALGSSRGTPGVAMVDVSPAPSAEVAGAACVDAEGRLVGVVASAGPSGPVALRVTGDRLDALVVSALRAMEIAEQAAASRASAPTGGAVAATPAASDRRGEVESDTERQRRVGAEAFDRAVSRLVGQRDGVTRLQARYDIECVGTYIPIVTVPGVGWPYPGGFAIEKSELPECKALKEQLDSRAEALRRGLADAEEQARRAGVYPGTLRDIKRAYGLEAIR